MTLVDTLDITIPSGKFYIVSKSSNQCIYLSRGRQLRVREKLNKSNQVWRIFSARNTKKPNCVHIKSISNQRLVVDVEGSRQDVGCPIISWPFHGRDNQKWKMIRTEDNDSSFYIISDSSDKCIEISQQATKSSSAFLVQNRIKGFDYQKWYLVPTNSDFKYSHSLNFMHVKKEVDNSALDTLIIKKGKVVRLDNIYFSTSESVLLPASDKELDKLIALLHKNSALRIIIYGHTDNVGNAEYNQQLSLKRAKCVYDHLIHKGINKERLSFKGFGSSKPIFTNKTDIGRSNNRRVEFVIL